MNKNITESIDLANSVKRVLYDMEEVEVVLCPPFTSLSDVSEVLIDTAIKVGAQDVHWEKEGAFTGEVSCGMLKNVGCEYVIIGHSERRQFFAETNETVNKKVKTALKEGLKPIVCVGEKLEERKANQTEATVRRHVTSGLAGLSKDQARHVVIAYEPVWAIGTGLTASPQQAQDVHAFIRGLLALAYDETLAQQVRIQYGGSVKPENTYELMGQKDIDGLLVGGASLKADGFSKIITESARAKGV